MEPNLLTSRPCLERYMLVFVTDGEPAVRIRHNRTPELVDGWNDTGEEQRARW